MTTPKRVNSFDTSVLKEFEPKIKLEPRATNEQINTVAEITGFPSRQALTTAPVTRSRRFMTGRNKQLNLKVTEDTLKRFYAIADEFHLPLGEVFERAVKALEDSYQVAIK
jgi:hypothetical protein